MTDTENHDIGFGKKIYIVEDDDSARELTLYALKTAGMEGVGFPDGKSFWNGMEDGFPDLILLDIMLPGGEDGSDILKKLKDDRATKIIPVIMTTAKGTEYDKVRELDNGADDYLVKPFGMMEMISRIKAVLRRIKKSSKGNEGVVIIGDSRIVINDEAHTVTLNGEPLELTLKEYELLKLFLNNPGKVFTRDNLLLTVWNEEIPPETRTVDVHVASLRKKIKDFGDRLETVRGVGYRYDKEDL